MFALEATAINALVSCLPSDATSMTSFLDRDRVSTHVAHRDREKSEASTARKTKNLPRKTAVFCLLEFRKLSCRGA